MSDGKVPRAVISGAALVALALIIVSRGGSSPAPANAVPDAECGQIGEQVCVPDGAGGLEPFCPALASCPTETTIVADAPTTVVVGTSVPPSAPPAPATVPPMPVGVEQAPAATDPPPDTAPPATGTQPERSDQLPQSAPQSPPTSCVTNDWRSVRQGDTWVSLADRLDVWTKDLLTVNGADKSTPLIVGDSVCRPVGPYDGQGEAPAQPAPTSPPTEAPRPTQAPATAPPIMPTQPPATSPPATAPAGTQAPKPQPTSPPATPAPASPPNTGTRAPKPTYAPPPSTTRAPLPKPTYPRPPSAPSTTRPSVV